MHSFTDSTITLRAGRARLDIALTGATPLRWFVPLADGLWDLLDGYRDTDELRSQAGVRNGIMAPFCNRVAEARYEFDGGVHDLRPGSADRTVYHGLVRSEPFRVTHLDQRPDGAAARLECVALADGMAVGYPFQVLVEVAYTLAAGVLGVEIAGRNTGAKPAPFASGWHPYFRLPRARTIDRLHLHVPAAGTIDTDAELVPLVGEAAHSANAVAEWQPLGGAVLDQAFARFEPGPVPGGTRLRDPVSGVSLTVQQEGGLMHVFTGDTLDRGRRASIALEPVEVMTNAFNRQDCADAIRLEPGERRTFRCSVHVTG